MNQSLLMLVFVAVSTTGCGNNRPETVSNQSDKTSKESIEPDSTLSTDAIVRAVVQPYTAELEHQKVQLVEELSISTKYLDLKTWIAPLVDYLEEDERNMLENLEAANHERVSLANPLAEMRVKMLSQNELAAIETDQWNDNYEALFERHPDSSHSLLRISRPSISDSKQKAIVFVVWETGILAAEGSLVFLESLDGKWVITGEVPLWVS